MALQDKCLQYGQDSVLRNPLIFFFFISALERRQKLNVEIIHTKEINYL